MKMYFTYKNYRGEWSEREAVPISARYTVTEYHTDRQWIMTAYDAHKQADRDFAMSDMSNVRPSCTFILVQMDQLRTLAQTLKELQDMTNYANASEGDDVGAVLREARNIVDSFTNAAKQIAAETAVQLTLPNRITPELREVLRAPAWRLNTLADAIRAAGHEMPKRHEDATAATMFTLLRFVLMYGSEWHREFSKYLGGGVNQAMVGAHALLDDASTDEKEAMGRAYKAAQATAATVPEGGKDGQE